MPAHRTVLVALAAIDLYVGAPHLPVAAKLGESLPSPIWAGEKAERARGPVRAVRPAGEGVSLPPLSMELNPYVDGAQDVPYGSLLNSSDCARDYTPGLRPTWRPPVDCRR